jgi:hypothetical protein
MFSNNRDLRIYFGTYLATLKILWPLSFVKSVRKELFSEGYGLAMLHENATNNSKQNLSPKTHVNSNINAKNYDIKF